MTTVESLLFATDAHVDALCLDFQMAGSHQPDGTTSRPKRKDRGSIQIKYGVRKLRSLH